MKFIEPKILATITNLPLIAKTVVDGFLVGAHANPTPGAGLEFNQYRGYQPGDDPRLLDWKMYARADRYYIREADIETSIHLRFVIDASASMKHADEAGLTKFDYARFLVATLAHLGYRQGDAIGLHMLGETSHHLPARQGRRHYHRFMQTLEQMRPNGVWPDWSRSEHALAGGRWRGMLIIVTDLHEHGEEMRHTLTKLSGMKHEIVIFQLLARNEIDLPYRGPVTFEDMETGERIKVVPEKVRESHRHHVDAAINQWRTELHDRRIAHEPMTTDQPLDQALRHFLNRRLRHA